MGIRFREPGPRADVAGGSGVLRGWQRQRWRFNYPITVRPSIRALRLLLQRDDNITHIAGNDGHSW